MFCLKFSDLQRMDAQCLHVQSKGESTQCRGAMQTERSVKQDMRAVKRVVRIRHGPLLLFLSLWHCLDVHIYWDFCLGRAMTEPHGRDRETERDHEDRGQKEEKLEDKRVGRENMVNIYMYRQI